jgi:membrane protease YdiL (CAAX protease family)
MVPVGTSVDRLDEEILKATLQPHNVGWARLSQVLGTFFLLFVPAWLFARVVHGKSSFWLGFNPYITGMQVIAGFFIIFAAGIVAAPFAELSKTIVAQFPDLNAFAKRLEDLYTQQALALSNLKSWPEFLMAIVILAFFPAMFEEVFFRGIMQNLFTKWWKAPMLAILVTSLIFSLIHFSVYLFISRAILGAALGLMYYYTRNIWVGIIAHFFNNLLALIQLFYLTKTNQKIELDKLDMQFGWLAAAAALVALIFLLRFLYNRSKENRQSVLMKEQLLVEQSDPFRSFNNPDQ